VFHFELEEGKTEKFLVRSASGPYAASLQLDEAELSKSLAQIPPWVFNVNAASASTRTAKLLAKLPLINWAPAVNYEAEYTGQEN